MHRGSEGVAVAPVNGVGGDGRARLWWGTAREERRGESAVSRGRGKAGEAVQAPHSPLLDRKSTRLKSSHLA